MAVGQVTRLLVGEPDKPQRLQNGLGTLAEGRLIDTGTGGVEEETPAACPALQMMGEDDVPQRGHLPEDHRLLEGADDPAACHDMRRQAADVFVDKPDAALARSEERRDQLEQCALASAIGSD